MEAFVQELAELDDQQLDAFLAELTDKQVKEFLYDWSLWARPEQLTPKGDWNVWLILAGRGWGKTRTGAEDQKDYGLTHPNSRIAIVAPTYADARDTCIEGESGLINVLPREEIRAWNRSLGELVLKNGTRYKLFSADEPERLRGPQHHRAWCDELCAWRYTETWDQLLFGLRLGTHPQIVVTTTPKKSKLIRDLISRKDVYVTKGNTFDNAANLAPVALQQLKARYLGTRMGRQELFAELLEDVEGALWQRDQMIETYRLTKHPPLIRIGVAVDPSVTSNEGSAETGIIAGGIAENGHAYILDDKSCNDSPEKWAKAAVTCYYTHQADRVIGEVNQGGDMVETIIRAIDPNISYQAVRATRGKFTRAEPIASFYERGLVHHVGAFPELEDQMCSWVQGEKSPDRLDALVWLLTALMMNNNTPLQGEPDPEPVKVPTLQEVLSENPFSYADRNGLWQE